VRILSIVMTISLFSSVFAGTLPADFKFKSAGNDRTSFISQFKEYQDQKENAVNENQEQALLSGISSTEKVDNHDEIEKNSNYVMRKVSNFFAGIMAYFSVNKK